MIEEGFITGWRLRLSTAATVKDKTGAVLD
jgi:hypothetical protein